MRGKRQLESLALSLVIAASFWASLASAREKPSPPSVVVSIQPLHALVAGVMAGVGDPLLLLKRGFSPHSYSLRPSEARLLNKADIVFWIGSSMETFLAKPLQSLGPKRRIVSLLEVAGPSLIPLRRGGGRAFARRNAKEPRAADREHGGERDLSRFNPHIWLDPELALTIVDAVADALVALDPARKQTYAANAERLAARLRSLDRELRELTAPVRGKPYIVFHDAFPYFERRYGLVPAGSFTLAPDRAPGARRLRELRERIVETGARCVFREPQFPSALLNMLAEEMNLETAELDPVGAGLVPGADAYFEMMRRIGAGIRRCLDPAFSPQPQAP